jgi:hypothetical protein
MAIEGQFIKDFLNNRYQITTNVPPSTPFRTSEKKFIMTERGNTRF